MVRFESHAIQYWIDADRWSYDPMDARILQRYVAEKVRERTKADAVLPYPKAMPHLRPPAILPARPSHLRR